jgi:hypothetical protein
MHTPTLLFTLLAASPLTAQLILHNVNGTHTGGILGQVVRYAGDVDGDGVADCLVTEPSYSAYGGDGIGRVHLVSGATGGVLWTFVGSSALDAVGIADVNFDGHRDVVVTSGPQGQAFVVSGATGQALFTVGGSVVGYYSLCDLGDINGDGRGDFAAIAVRNNGTQIDVVSGNGGAVLGTISGLSWGSSFPAKITKFVDITGDGKPEFAVANGQYAVYICSPSPVQVVRILASPSGSTFGRSMGTADVDGDGVAELLVENSNVVVPGVGVVAQAVHAISASSGLVVRTFLPDMHVYPNNPAIGRSICSLGDLDGDGAEDFVTIEEVPPNLRLVVFSGRTGAQLAVLDGTAAGPYYHTGEYYSTYLDSLGDVDGDGFVDFAVGTLGSLQGFDNGGYQIISGKILADVTYLGGACGGGPFLPQLGVTRPIIGQTATVACRDGAPGALGTLAFSLRPTLPTYLGASSCTAFIDAGNWIILLGTSQVQWTLPVPVPNAPQLAGLEVALQCYYAPTTGPMGFDLTNGLYARIGY